MYYGIINIKLYIGGNRCMKNEVNTHGKNLKGMMLKRLLPLIICGCLILGITGVVLASKALIKSSDEYLKEIGKIYANNIELNLDMKSQDEIHISNEESHFSDTGVIYVIDKEGTVILHSDETIVAEKRNYIKESDSDSHVIKVHQAILDGESGVDEYSINGVKKRVSYNQIADTGLTVIVEVDRADVLSQIKIMSIFYIIASIIIIIVLSAGVILNATSISRKIKEVMKILSSFSKGDFNNKIEVDGLEDQTEIGEMFNALNATQISISEIIVAIKSGSINVEGHSASLAAVSEELSALTENIVKAIEDVAAGTTTQATDLGDIVTEVSSFGEKLQSVSNSMVDIDLMSGNIAKESEKSDVELNGLVSSIGQFNNYFNNFNDLIKTMSKDIRKVNEMADLINSISEQTNLLALNAAIEAARAGEAGRGFAVVAEEIRTLAERSKESTENIYKTVGVILVNTENITNSTEQMNSELSTQGNVVDKTIEAFKEISKAVESIMPKVSEIGKSFDEISQNKNIILSKVENLSAVSEQIAATAQEVSASSEELNSASAEVAISAQNLTVLTAGMNETIDVLKI